MIISRISTFTGAINVMDIPITQEQFDAYNCGDKAIQDMFPTSHSGTTRIYHDWNYGGRMAVRRGF